MQKDDTSRISVADIWTSIALLTRIPVQARFDRPAQAAWAYPLAGLPVALLAAIVVFVVLWLGVAPALAAGLWIATTAILTGAMHEDGLADCADGFWGGFEKSRRLEIMKDSQIGTYGVLALLLSTGLRWFAVMSLIEGGAWFWPLLALEILSRATMPAMMHHLPHARDTGLSHAQGQPPQTTAMMAAALGFGLCFLCLGWVAIKLALLTALLSFGAAQLAKHKIGGQTGDVLGATQQLVLITGLLALA